MGSLKTLWSLAALLGLSAPALAADMLPPPPPYEAGPAVSELGSGWYLRGDAGYIEYSKPKEAVGYSAGLPFDSIRMPNTWSIGGGAGYSFNNWFRADVTVDWRADARITALSSGSNYVNGFSTDAPKFESTTFLLNGYVDLGKWFGVTPYVGAGVGLAHNRLHDYWSQVTCLTAVCSAAFSQDRVMNQPGSKNNLAWALMAGAAVDIGSGFKLDLGYRYLHIGDARTQLDAGGFGFKLKPLDAHEARIGVRYMID
jgi:opacity protein-like surface antigen